jgi:hypothetical protein
MMHLTAAEQDSFPNKETQFKKGKSGNPNGRPKGSISLSQRIKGMLKEGANCPSRSGTRVLDDDREHMRLIDPVGYDNLYEGNMRA